MKHLKTIFACLLMAVLSIGQVWADDPAAQGATLFSEDFSGYAKDAVPSGSVTTATGRVVYGNANVTYACTNGESGSTTAIYADALATGTSPEIMIGKYGSGGSTGGSFSVTGIPSGGAQEITVSFKQNKQKLKVAVAGTGYTSDGVDAKPASAGTVSFDITVGDGAASTFDLTFSVYSSNVRVDDILVTVKTAGEGGAPAPTLTGVTVSGNPTKKEYSAGDNFDPAGLTVTGTYSDASTAPITSGITWTYNPSQTLVKDQTSIGVIATVSEIASAEYNVTGLTVTAASPKITITQDEVADFTNTYAEYTWTAGGVSGKMFAYKNSGMQFNSSKTGYYVYNTDAIPGRITKITMTQASGTARTWTPYVSTTAMTSASGTALEAKSVTTSGVSWDVTGSNSYFYLTVAGGSTVIGSIVIEYTEAAPPAIDAPSISGDVNFVGSTTVTISHDDAEHIYYTTNGDDPTMSSTEYLAPFTVDADGTTTVKAIAVKGSDVSDPATKTFTKVEALESLAALLEATTSTETGYNVVISDWVVTGAISNRAWISNAENTKGILLYKSGHGFTAGKKLNGVVLGTKAKIYQGYPELTSLVSTEVTVADADEITPRTTTLAALVSGYNVEQGTLVKLENVTYAAGTGFSDGINTVALSTQLYGPTMVDGATYNIIGVVRYDNGPVYSIMPRSVNDVEQTGGGGMPEVDGLAALKAETTGSSYLLNLTDAIVTLVDGSNAFIEDATAGALIYKSGHGFSAGDKLNGQYEVTTSTFQGKFEITAITATTGTKTTDAAIPETTLTIAQLNANFAANESKRIKIVGVNVTDAVESGDATARTGEISDGVNTITLYAGKSGVTAALNDNIDVIGYPTYHNTDEQLAVWAQADITVNVKDPAGISYTPSSETITGGDPWSAPTFSNPNSLTVTFSGDNDAVATVNTTTGEIALAGGYGTAVITAHTDGDATHNAGNATYTITVNDPGATPVYTMSFDMTRASYDDAADAQVVWNSNVVTMTADKNDGTKVTNYLAGNYSGTTLIAETRLYAKNSISFVPQSGVTITKIEWMSTAKGYATKLAAETFVNATAVVDGTDDKLVIITPSAAGEISVTLTDAARATNVKVYYEAESEKAKLTASISIDDMNMAVGDADILLSAIAATSNPNKKAISYAVTSGTAVTIEGTGAEAALHAAAEGSATITATIPDDLGNYTGATTTFDIVVAAAPATLESIAISGTASVLEYTEGQDFNPAGLVVTGTYSDASTAPISEGITWAYDPSPLTQGTTSVSVTATVSEISSSAFVVNGLTVSAAAAPTVDNVVILAVYDTKYYAMSTTNANNGFTAIAVEYDGTQVTVKSEAEKTAIQWTRTTTGDNTTFQDADSKYMKSADGASMSLETSVCNWLWDATEEYYKISGTSRTFFFQNTSGGIFKNYAASNIGGTGYSDKAQVIVIDPANIVVTSKVSAELAYDPESDEITQGNAWSAPSLVNPYTVTITSYASDNEAVATVEGGVIALAGGIGTAHITAHFDGDASYLEGDAVYTITVNAPAPTPSGTSYVKVTSTADITADGEYLLVNENALKAFNGNLETLDAEGNTVDVVISGGKIAGTSAIDAAIFTIDASNGNLRSHSGHYVGVGGYSNGLAQSDEAGTYANVFAINASENVDITITFTGGDMHLLYNTANRFRYYKAENQTNKAIQLYKKESSTPEPEYETVRGGLTAGNYYTICLPKKVVNFRGASIWNLEKRNTAETEVYLEEAQLPFAAGTPFIIQATAATLEVVYEGDATEIPVESGALRGTLSGMTYEQLEAAGAHIYILKDNEIRPIMSGNFLSANRAYIDYDVLEAVSEAPTSMPGKKVKRMPMQGQTTTDCELINAAEAPVKMMINGQLFILRGEKMYDTTGRLVK